MVVVVVVGSSTVVVQELRNAARAGRIQMSVNFFIIRVVTPIFDSLQVPMSDVLEQILLRLSNSLFEIFARAYPTSVFSNFA